MSIFRRKTSFEFERLPKLPELHLQEPISHVQVIPPQPTPVEIFDWQQEEEEHEPAVTEAPATPQETLAPVIGTIGLEGFERDGKIDPRVVNYLQEAPVQQSDRQ